MIFANFNILNTLLWNKIMVIGSTGMPITFFFFVQEFLKKDRHNWVGFGLLIYVVTQIANFTGLLITESMLEANNHLNVVYGDLIILPSLSWVFFLGFAAYDMILELFRSKDSNYRNRLKYLLFVLGIIFIGSLTNATYLQGYPIDITLNAFCALLITYAIFRHQLLDISVVVRKGLLYSIPTIFIGASYFLIISVSINVVSEMTTIQVILISIIVAAIAEVVAQPLRDKAQSWIDKFFFREKYDSFLMLQRISRTSATVLDIEKLTHMILTEVASTLHIKIAFFMLRDENSGEFRVLSSVKGNWQYSNGLNNKFILTNDHPIVHQFIKYDHPITMSEIDVMPQFRSLWTKEMDDLQRIKADLLLPMKSQNKLVGIFIFGQKLSEETYSSDDILTLTTMANQTIVALDNARLYGLARRELADRKKAEDRLQLQLKRMNALHTIDIAITSSVNLKLTLDVLLDVTTSQLNVDAAAILLMDPHTHFLEYAANRGFQTIALKHTRLSMGDGLAGQAAVKQSIIYIPNLLREATPLDKSPLLSEEKFISYFGVPLIAKGKIKGVLEIFNRTHLDADPEWMEYLDTLATETAIAVDNSEMFNDLQRSNLELTQAYVTTLEGWSRALELRDQETDGHSQRVTEITIELARKLGIKSGELVQIRRGALLHDIGKMGIPDNILLKAGPLSDDEWKIMRQHPVYAFKLLSAIPFLRPALDIPHFHHERWDGSGYPLGLSGEVIPLAARVFAVVDVWDALLSDRPYRKGWPEEKVMQYLRENKNIQFDPKIVDAFIQLRIEKPEVFRREPWDYEVEQHFLKGKLDDRTFSYD